MTLRLPIYDGYAPTLAAVEQVPEPLDRDVHAPTANGKGRQCALCVLGKREKLRTPCLPAEGVPGGLLVVGEAPALDDDLAGRPMVGAAGQVLRKVIKAHWSGPVAFDFALRCAPARGVETKPAMVNACRAYLAQTIAEVRPQRVLALGSVAWQGIFGRALSPLTARRGYGWLRGDLAPVPVYSIIAPTHALRNRFMRQWFEADIAHACTSPLPPDAPWEAEATVVSNLRLAEHAASRLSAQRWISFDVETAGRMWTPDFRIISTAVCGADDDDVWVWGREAMQDSELRAVLVRLLTARSLPKVGQNVKYDQLAFRAAHGVAVRPVLIDTRLQRKLLDPEADGKLSKMAELVGMGGHKEEADEFMKAAVARVNRAFNAKPLKKVPDNRERKIAALELPAHIEGALRAGFAVDALRFDLLPDETLYRYNARDALVTKKLAVHLGDEIAREPALQRTWETIVRPAAVALERVEGWGVCASRDAIKAFDLYLEQGVTRSAAVLSQYEPAGGINWNSDPQVRQLLFVTLGLSPNTLFTTPTGAFSVGKEALADLEKRTGHPLPRALIEYNWLTHLRNTYAQGMYDHVRSDGRIHPNIKLDGARSGRTSCIRRGTLIEIVRDVNAQPLGVPVEDVRVGDLAYCYDDDGNLRIRPVVKTWARGKRKLVRVHWRSHGGRTGHLDLTPDHRLGKTDGSWCEAGKLIPGDHLFAMGRRVRRDGYAYVQPTASPELREHRFIFEEVFGWSPEAVHHKNERKSDNRVSNLEGMTKAAHNSHHGGENTPTHLRDFRARKLQAQHEAGAIPRLTGERNGRWKPLTLEEATALLRASAWSVKHAAKEAGRDFQCFKDHLVRLGLDIDELKRMNREGRKEQIADGAAKARAARKVNNHVVTRVEVLDEADEVFDLMIEEHHNFIAGELRSKNCTDPNLQNIPRAQTVEGKMSRDIFCAPPGFVLIEADYSQLELRVAAMLSGDAVMRSIFEEGVDYHLRTAQMVSRTAWGIAPEQVTDAHRSIAKTINFGILYGKGAGGFAQEWGISKAKAQGIVDAIMGQFKDLKRWCDARENEARKTGFVWTWWAGQPARHRPLYRIADRDDYVASVARNGAKNTPIQGTASDFCIASLRECVEWIEQEGLEDDVKLVLSIHDALMFEVRESMVDEVCGTVNEIMVGHDSAGVPLVADFKTGPAWGSMMKREVA